MQNLILTPVAVPELVDLIASEVLIRMNRTEAPEPVQDRITLDDAVLITGLKRSAIYKMTMTGDIPCQKFGKRLIFSRGELAQWMQDRTIRKRSHLEEATAHLQDEANKKRA